MKKFFAAFIAVFVFASCAPRGEWTLTIYHTGDVHGHAMAYGEAIGYGKTAAYVSGERAKNKNTLFLDVGDAFYGMPAADTEKGDVALDVMNLMGYDAFTLGNADFVWGGKHVENLFGKAAFPIVCANVYYNNNRIYKPYIVKKVNGTRFAIAGLAPLNAQVATLESRMEGYEIRNPIDELNAIMPQMQKESDVIIVLAHIGKMDPDVNVEKLVNAVPGIDLIIDGHDHARLEAGQKINDTFIVNAGEYNKWLGELSVKFDGKKITEESARLYDKNFFADIAPHEKIEALVKSNYDRIESILGKTVFTAPFYLEGRREAVRASQTNLGSIYADAERELAGADAAWTVGAFLRDSIDAGPVTRNKLLSVLPFFHPLVTREMSGKQIVDFIEHNYYDSMRDPKVFSGAYAHVSGITFTADFSLPQGSRMKDVKIGGEPADMNKKYLVACNEQISDYGIRDIQIKDRIEKSMADIFADYVNAHKDLKEPEVRVKIVNR